jgi:hypothetical protein
MVIIVRRGRPLTFKQEMRRQLAALVERHGAHGARELSPVPITVDSLLKIAREFGIRLRKGRRPQSLKA